MTHIPKLECDHWLKWLRRVGWSERVRMSTPPRLAVFGARNLHRIQVLIHTGREVRRPCFSCVVAAAGAAVAFCPWLGPWLRLARARIRLSQRWRSWWTLGDGVRYVFIYLVLWLVCDRRLIHTTTTPGLHTLCACYCTAVLENMN